ncbi:MAG: hypothetical protein EPO11_07005 [Gammaproteobacteria bacterium]|nr:MAG: hypothetical protein EPO11_07005 [Gammaproteobacteria bacterium]
MALDFSKFNFSRMDARTRIFFLLAFVISIILLIYIASRFFGGSEGTGASRVASAPVGLQSVQGGTLTPEYRRAVEQANVQRAEQAQITGTSAVPTMINVGRPSVGGSQCVICTEDQNDTKSMLDDWLQRGQVSAEIANQLKQLADKNVSVDEYAATLDQLVKEGKLTPEQARQLLEQYKKQHANALAQESAKTMDTLIKSGQVPLGVANDLLAAQKAGVSTAEYAGKLQDLVQQGKISPAIAQQLLAQYTQQRAREAAKDNIAAINKMAANGEITAEVAKELTDLANRGASVDDYAAALQRDVAAGKLTPAAAAKLLDNYRKQKTTSGTVNELLKQAEAEAYGEINDLVKAGKMPREVGEQLTSMLKKDAPADQYKAALMQFVQQKQITPEIAKLKWDDYQKVRGLRDASQQLAALQGRNVPAGVYADELKRMVQAGVITPEQAAQLMKEYQAMAAAAAGPAGGGGPTTSQFAALQQRVQQAAVTQPAAGLTANEFDAAQVQAQAHAEDQRKARISALANAMSGQAQQLVTSWQPPVQAYKEGSAASAFAKEGAGAAGKGTDTKGTAGQTPEGAATGAPIIKAGSILFAVLDTAVNSDYPDSPVMATVVEGPFKGAKLLGKLTTAKSVSGQLDRISLNFTLMDMDQWDKTKSVTGYAIDPDTARTVLASSVDYHYMQRFGAMMATSFLQGYASAITNAGTSTTGIFGTSTTHPDLSPSQKLAVALGQMGQTVGAATQNYINRAPTVRVDSGVGIGILFMADVT